MIKVKIGRDAGSGKFITVQKAENRPKTAIVETIKREPTKHSKKK